MWTAISFVAIGLGGLGHLLILGLCLFGMANASPEQLRQIRLWMLAIAAVAVLVAGAGVLLWRVGHPGWGTAINLASPVVVFVVLLRFSTP